MELVWVTTSTFRVCWCCAFLMRWVTVCSLMTTTIGFNYLRKDSDMQNQNRRQFWSASPLACRNIMAIQLMLLSFHFNEIVGVSNASLKMGQLVFHERVETWDELMQRVRHQSISALVASFTWSMRYNVSAIGRVTKRLGQILFKILTLPLSIDSDWFDEVYAVQQLVKMLFQTYQVSRIYLQIDSDAIRSLAIVTLFRRAIAGLAIETYFFRVHRQEISIEARFLFVACDAMGDSVFATVIWALQSLDPVHMSLGGWLYDVHWFTLYLEQNSLFGWNSNMEIVMGAAFLLALIAALRQAQQMIACIPDDDLGSHGDLVLVRPRVIRSFAGGLTAFRSQREYDRAVASRPSQLVSMDGPVDDLPSFGEVLVTHQLSDSTAQKLFVRRFSTSVSNELSKAVERSNRKRVVYILLYATPSSV